jgi:hypothetical protein
LEADGMRATLALSVIGLLALALSLWGLYALQGAAGLAVGLAVDAVCFLFGFFCFRRT